MGEKKRKRHGEENQGLPRKKVALNSSKKGIKVSIIENDTDWSPLLASTPGFNLPRDAAFDRYSKPRSNHPRSSATGQELLLHSSAHPKLDYTACEESSNGSDAYLKHFVGVYDPKTGSLRLVQARKMVVRSILRSARVGDKENCGQTKENIPSTLSARSNLGLAFGTKKSQKAIRALTANAIQASPSKPKPEDPPEQRRQLDPLASAVVSSMADASSSMATREELQAEMNESKPVPRPNLQASTPAEVYPIDQLAGSANTLATVGVKEWIDKVNAGEDVQTRSRFVAKRLLAAVHGGDVKRLKALRYLLLLIEWHIALKPGSRGTKKVPKAEDIAPILETYGSELMSGVAKRFADGGQLNKWHMDYLMTHILALAISLDNFTTDTNDIREDLKLETKDVMRYYAELGCSTAAPTDVQRNKLGLTKAEASSHRIATLRLPLVFPKMRVPASGKKRR